MPEERRVLSDDKGGKVLVLPPNTSIVAPQEVRTLSTKQINALNVRTPRHYLKKRPAKGGGSDWDYVTAGYVKRQLNRIFGHENWSFEVKSSMSEAFEVATRTGSCTILGKLTVYTQRPQPIIKEQFGRAEVKFKKGTTKPLDFGNDMKAAASDALKKCAADLGIAADVYNKQEYIEIVYEDAEVVEPKEAAATAEKTKLTTKADELLESIQGTKNGDTKQAPANDKHQGTDSIS